MLSAPQIDVKKMIFRKAGIVTKMTNGIEFLFRKHKVTFFKAHARFSGKTGDGYRVDVTGKTFDDVITAKNVVIATGSKARQPSRPRQSFPRQACQQCGYPAHGRISLPRAL